MSKTLVILVCVTVALVAGETSGPYQPKGWKPQGARLELPSRQYGVPRNINEIDLTTPANEEFVPTTTEQEEISEDDALRVQALPSVESIAEFRKFQQRRPLKPQFANIQMAPAPAFVRQPLLLSPVFAPQFAPASQRLQENQFGRDVQQLPARAYGAPPQQPADEDPSSEESSEEELPEQPLTPADQPQDPDYDSDEVNDDSEEESGDTVIAVSNVGDSAQALRQGRVGQYYILLPDNSLQKVRFATKQTVEDRQNNGFSAQLRYSPVEAIKDPVYGYDQQGKIVRLYK